MHSKISIALFLCISTSNAIAAADELSPANLARVHLQRVHLYYGWEFHYQSSFVEGDQAPLDLENTLALATPLRRNSQVVRRLWTAHRDNPGEPHLDDPSLLHYFAGWNGKECRYYERKYLANITGGSNESTAQKFATEYVKYNGNFFDNILTSGPHWVPQYLDPSGEMFDDHPAKFHVTGKGERLGIPTLKLVAMIGTDARFEAELSDSPENLLMYLAIYHRGSEPNLECEITSVGTFENTLYPKSGRVYEAKLGDFPQRDYEFTVEKVTRINRTPEAWFPPWPEGTVVIDQTNGAKQTVIPYPPKTVNRIRHHRTSSPIFRSFWTIASWAFILCILGVLAYVIIRRSRSQ